MHDISNKGLYIQQLQVLLPDGSVLLRDISFSTPSGSVFHIGGPSGSGKSLLLETICGIYPYFRGDIRFSDLTLQSAPIRQWRRLFGFVPANPPFFDGNILENLQIALPGKKRPRSGKHTPAVIGPALTSMGLPLDIIEKQPMQCSTGQRQRIALIRALLFDPEVYLLDEPFAHLDEQHRDTAARIFAEELNRNKIILLTSHHPSLPLSLSERLFGSLTLSTPRSRHSS